VDPVPVPVPVDVTTVADDLVVAHVGTTVHRLDGLEPGTQHEVAGRVVRTLDRPPGALLCRIATVNDVHFGETEAGRIDDLPQGPVQRREPDEDPYPETMNRGAAAEIAAIDPAAVFVKGDLSNDGLPEEWDAFEACYRSTFGDRLHVVRGNHDAYRGQTCLHRRPLDGAAGRGRGPARHRATHPHSTGWITDEQLDWLDDHAATPTARCW
jgi:Icc protein